MAMQFATLICTSFLCQVAYAGIYEDYAKDGQFSRYLSADNDTNTTLSGPPPRPPPPPTPPPTDPTTPAPTPPALVQTVTVGITDVSSAPDTTALETAAQDACKGDCTVSVVEEFKVALTFTFDSYPCTGVTVLDVRTSIATSLSVEVSQVTAEVEVTGCRRLLKNGERRLTTGSATVTSSVSYPDSDSGKAAATSTMSTETATIASGMATALSTETGVTIATPTVASPTLSVEQTLVVTPPADGEVPDALSTAQLEAALPEGTTFTSEALSTKSPTPPPTVGTKTLKCDSLCGPGYTTAAGTTIYTKEMMSLVYPYITGEGNLTCSDLETIVSTNGTTMESDQTCSDFYKDSQNATAMMESVGVSCCTAAASEGVASLASAQLQPMLMTIFVVFACAAMTTREWRQ